MHTLSQTLLEISDSPEVRNAHNITHISLVDRPGKQRAQFRAAGTHIPSAAAVAVRSSHSDCEIYASMFSVSITISFRALLFGLILAVRRPGEGGRFCCGKNQPGSSGDRNKMARRFQTHIGGRYAFLESPKDRIEISCRQCRAHEAPIAAALRVRCINSYDIQHMMHATVLVATVVEMKQGGPYFPPPMLE